MRAGKLIAALVLLGIVVIGARVWFTGGNKAQPADSSDSTPGPQTAANRGPAPRFYYFDEQPFGLGLGEDVVAVEQGFAGAFVTTNYAGIDAWAVFGLYAPRPGAGAESASSAAVAMDEFARNDSWSWRHVRHRLPVGLGPFDEFGGWDEATSLGNVLTDYVAVDQGTGLRVPDLVVPYAKGGKIGLFGGAGNGKTVLITELLKDVARSTDGFSVFAGFAGSAAVEDLANSQAGRDASGGGQPAAAISSDGVFTRLEQAGADEPPIIQQWEGPVQILVIERDERSPGLFRVEIQVPEPGYEVLLNTRERRMLQAGER